MDDFYPHKKAAEAVEAWNLKLSQPDAPFSQLGLAVPAGPIDPAQIIINVMADGRGAKAMFPVNHREAVFTVAGILSARDLPPLKKSDISPAKARYIKQHATIVGYNTALFDRAVDNIHHIAFEMCGAFEDGEMQPWTPGEASPRYGVRLSSNCRYFTTGFNISDDLKTPFDASTDPHGLLKSYLSDSVSHCLDNDVAYMTLVQDSYTNRNPSAFRVGDLVEMGFAFVAWQLPRTAGGPRFTSRLVLRTLTFLDGSFTKEAFIARSAASAKVARPIGHSMPMVNQIAKRRLKDVVAGDSAEEDDIPAVRMKLIKLMVADKDASPPTYESEQSV